MGRPVERLYSLFPWAREQGRAQEYLHGFAHAAFAEGIDTGTDAGLRRVVEGAGLRWDEALEHLEDESWRDELEANRQALALFGRHVLRCPHKAGDGLPGALDHEGQPEIG